MTLCKEYICHLIRKEGFISIAEFMAAALYHPEFGYYMQRQPLGSNADFITSPEISLLFGETLCFWAVEHYYRLHQPKKIALVELGPGRGILMSDFLRTAQLLPDFFNALDIHLLETSPKLQATQQYIIHHPRVFWHEEVAELLEAIHSLPVFIIANEFFDALPVRQFQKTSQGWAERGVIISEDHTLSFGIRDIEVSNFSFPLVKTDAIIEYCPLAEDMMRKLVHHLNQVSGAFVSMDYGYVESYGDTLQAVSRHRYVPVLENPGAADITAHVNFRVLKEIAGEKAKIATQSEFLMKHGIVKLAQAHAHNASEADKNQLALQLYKLTSSQQMGTLFKALEVMA